MLLLPTWDAIVGKYYLDGFCDKNGGNYILKNERVDGVTLKDGSYSSEIVAAAYIKMGFDFVEMGSEGNFQRFTMDGVGRVKSVKIPFPTAKYSLDFNRSKVGPKVLNITLAETYLLNNDTGKKIGRYRNYSLYTKIDEAISGIGSGVATRCTDIERFSSRKQFENRHEFIERLTGKIK